MPSSCSVFVHSAGAGIRKNMLILNPESWESTRWGSLKTSNHMGEHDQQERPWWQRAVHSVAGPVAGPMDTFGGLIGDYGGTLDAFRRVADVRANGGTVGSGSP